MNSARLTIDLSAQIEQWRQNLLDTTKRNRLISFKSGRIGGISLVRPDPGGLWHFLVSANQSLTFPWKRTLVELPEAQREALELVRRGRTIPDVAGSLGVSPQSLRNWMRQDERDRGERDDGLTSAERDELRELRTRVKRLQQERDILKRATALFARETETR